MGLFPGVKNLVGSKKASLTGRGGQDLRGSEGEGGGGGVIRKWEREPRFRRVDWCWTGRQGGNELENVTKTMWFGKHAGSKN